MLRTALPLLVATMLMLVPDALSAQLRAAPANEATPAAVGTLSPESAAARLSPAGAPPALRVPVSSGPGDLAPAQERKEREDAPTRALQTRDRGGIPFMVAGGALFIAGAVVGGDAGTLLMVGGSGLGAYGLYVYFGGS